MTEAQDKRPHPPVELRGVVMMVFVRAVEVVVRLVVVRGPGGGGGWCSPRMVTGKGSRKALDNGFHAPKDYKIRANFHILLL